MHSFFVTLGLLGVGVNLVAYGLLTAGKLKAESLRYQIVNAAGTTGILLSLVAQWNLPVFISNVAWLLIACIGIGRVMLRTKRGNV